MPEFSSFRSVRNPGLGSGQVGLGLVAKGVVDGALQNCRGRAEPKYSPRFRSSGRARRFNRQLLAPRRLGIHIARRAQHRDEDLGAANLVNRDFFIGLPSSTNPASKAQPPLST